MVLQTQGGPLLKRSNDYISNLQYHIWMKILINENKSIIYFRTALPIHLSSSPYWTRRWPRKRWQIYGDPNTLWTLLTNFPTYQSQCLSHGLWWRTILLCSWPFLVVTYRWNKLRYFFFLLVLSILDVFCGTGFFLVFVYDLYKFVWPV